MHKTDTCSEFTASFSGLKALKRLRDILAFGTNYQQNKETKAVTWGRDVGGEWWSGNVLVGKFDDDAVLSGNCRQVTHGTCAVLIVHAVYLRLRRTLNRQWQAACSNQQHQAHSECVKTATRRAFSRAHTSPRTLTFDPDLPKVNHLVPCGLGYDWRSLVTIGLELAPVSCSQTSGRKQPPITFGGGVN